MTQGVYDDVLASALFESINQSRRDVYLSELTWSNELSQVAKTRAKELLITFDHKRPDGRLWDTVSSHVYAENIAYGQKTSEEAQAGFMQSNHIVTIFSMEILGRLELS
ncbi:CAP domain-containing protein [Erysipelothrix sp. D19-032]